MADTRQGYADRELDRTERRKLLANLARFQGPSAWRSVLQFASTALAYTVAIAAMYAALKVSVWLALVISIPAAGLVVRLFIIQHDCGHGSYFRSPRANEIVGWLCSIVTLTPYSNWRRQHAGHHAVWNNLDERHGGADIYSACLTLQEYLDLPAHRRWFYRVTRHPVRGAAHPAAICFPTFVSHPPRCTANVAQGAPRRLLHEPSARDDVFGARRSFGLETCSSRAAAGHGFCLYRRRLAVLGTAPVRGFRMVPPGTVDTAQSCTQRQLLPETPSRPSMVHREYRIPSRASPYAARAQLPPANVSRGATRPRR